MNAEELREMGNELLRNKDIVSLVKSYNLFLKAQSLGLCCSFSLQLAYAYIVDSPDFDKVVIDNSNSGYPIISLKEV